MRIARIFAAAIVSAGIIGLVAGPAEAATRSTGSPTTVTSSKIGTEPTTVASLKTGKADKKASKADKKASKADKKFVLLMRSSSNPDRDLYLDSSTKSLHRIGVAVCGLIKAYDKREAADDAVLDSLVHLEAADDDPYTDDGDAWLLVASVNSYCAKYVKVINSF